MRRSMCSASSDRSHFFFNQLGFDFEIKYIPGQKNVLADCFLQLLPMEKPTDRAIELQGEAWLKDFNNSIKLPKYEGEIIERERERDCLTHGPHLFNQINWEATWQQWWVIPPGIGRIFAQPTLTGNNWKCNHQKQYCQSSSNELLLQNMIMRDQENYQHHLKENHDVIHGRALEPNRDRIWRIVYPQNSFHNCWPGIILS